MAGLVRFGMHAKATGVSNNQAFTDMQNGGGTNPDGGTGQLALRRTYSTGAPPSSWASAPCSQDVTVHGVDISILSAKGPIATWNSGGYESNIQGLIDTMPANHTLILACWNEPENKGISAATWRQATKRLHRYVHLNRGSKDVRVTTALIVTTPEPGSGAALEDWLPVYQSSDTGAYAPPPGFAVGQLAVDVVGLHFYDRYPDNNTAAGRREFDPVAGGNSYGLSGFLDEVVRVVNTYPNASMTRSDLVWLVGELGTERTGTACTSWMEDLLYKARDDASTCVGYAWFESDTSGDWAPFHLPADTQSFFRTNGPYFDSNPVAGTIGTTTELRYDVTAATGDPGTIGTTTELRYDVDPVTNQVITLPTGFSVGDAMFVAVAAANVTSWPAGWTLTAGGADEPGQVGYRILDGTEVWFGETTPQIELSVATGDELVYDAWYHASPGTITVTKGDLTVNTVTVPLPAVNREGPFTAYAVGTGLDPAAGLTGWIVDTNPSGFTAVDESADTKVIIGTATRSYGSGPQTVSGSFTFGEGGV